MITLKHLDRTPTLAELKVSYRRGQAKNDSQDRLPTVFRSPTGCEKYLRTVWDDDTIELREEFVLLCLNGAHEVLGWVKLHTGGFNQSPVDLRLVLAVALQTASTAIIIAHNHPSGSLEPSQADKEITDRLKRAGDLIGLRVLDHMILTRGGYYSFCEHGLI